MGGVLCAEVFVVVHSEEELDQVGGRVLVLDAGDHLEEQGRLPPEILVCVCVCVRVCVYVCVCACILEMSPI